MCGIVGQISKNNTLNEKFILKNREILLHRGSTEYKEYQRSNYFIAHHLLSLTGVKNIQPFENKNVYYTVNGEFYNYQKIQNKIDKTKQLKSDSELIVSVYEKNKMFKFLREGKLQGEFACFIIDENKNKAYLFRDHFGIKPLYYYVSEDNIYISSEIKSFKTVDTLSFDKEVLDHVLSLQYHSDETTLFKNVYQVPINHIVEIDLLTLEIKKIKFFDFFDDIQEDSLITEEEVKLHLNELISKSVKKRISNTKRKIGLTLSGGIDSGIIFSECSEQVTPYTVKFENGNIYDESVLARELCDKYNKELNIVSVSPMQLLENFENAIKQAEEVSINLHQSAKYMLFKAMQKDDMKISLSGEGSDEIFFGYEHFKKDLNLNYNDSPYLNGIHSSDTDNFNTTENNFLNNKLGYVPNFLNVKKKVGNEISNYLKSSINDNYLETLFLEDLNNKKEIDNAYKSSYLWSKMCLSNYILLGLGDKMEMNANMGGRIPFLDFDLVKFVKTIPVSMKIKGIEKYILREAYKDKLTDNIYKKNKHPFIAPPLFKWSNDINEFVINKIKNDISELSFIDKDKLLNAYINNKLTEQAFFLLWSLSILNKEYCK